VEEQAPTAQVTSVAVPDRARGLDVSSLRSPTRRSISLSILLGVERVLTPLKIGALVLAYPVAWGLGILVYPYFGRVGVFASIVGVTALVGLGLKMEPRARAVLAGAIDERRARVRLAELDDIAVERRGLE
jgi:hypothetical protein